MNINTELTIGMDIGDKTSVLFAVDAAGQVVLKKKLETNPDGMCRFFEKFRSPEKVLVAMEAGTHSPWLSDLLEHMGFGIVVANPRKLRAIWGSNNKTDDRDAEMLARLARSDLKLLAPIKHRGVHEHADLMILSARDGLVKARSALSNQVRGLVKSFGVRIPSCSTEAFAKVASENLPDYCLDGLSPLLDAHQELTNKIREYDRMIETVAKEKYPQTEKLRQIKGVGAITSLAFVLIIGDPRRFHKSRDVGPYLGLTRKQDQSGSVDKPLGITKAGNSMMRWLLVTSANYIMGPFGEDCDLLRAGNRIAAKGEQIARRKAKVAVARKLGVLMHRLLLSDEEYQPLRNQPKSKTETTENTGMPAA